MAVICSQIRLGPENEPFDAVEAAIKKTNLAKSQISNIQIYKVSVDARHARDRHAVSFVYSVWMELKDPGLEELLPQKYAFCRYAVRPASPCPQPGNEVLAARPVVAGFGPAGIFAALTLARHGYRPLVLERGGRMEQRVEAVEGFFHGGAFSTESNIQFGEGGAGTFSDGKLTTRISDPLCGYVLQVLADHGAPPDILTKAKPHIGTDYLRRVVTSLREEIIRLGGEVRFLTPLEDLRLQNGKLCGITAGGAALPCEAMILATGHSARNIFRLAAEKGIGLQPKPFSVGLRIEHLQSSIDHALYGPLAGDRRLPPGEYQLSYRQGSRAVYTFCMCPGGEVVPSCSEEHTVVTNGMSRFARDRANANAALVVSVDAHDFGAGVLDGVAFQQALESAAFEAGGKSYRAPCQTVGSFLGRQTKFGRVSPSYALGGETAELKQLFSPSVSALLESGIRQFDRRLRGFADPEAVLTGVETRTSSPVRILRGDNSQAFNAQGVFPCGEGAGYAGGIMSAAVDGVKTAVALIRTFAPPR